MPDDPINLRLAIEALCGDSPAGIDHEAFSKLLHADPLAQEEYLDQMLMHGFLHHHFSGFTHVSQVIPDKTGGGGRFYTPYRKRAIVACMSLAACLMIMASYFARNTSTDKGVLANASFEQEGAIAIHPALSVWYGDLTQVVDQLNDVRPEHGENMLQLLRSVNEPMDSCEVYQVIDLRDVPQFTHRERLLVEASAAINSIDAEDGGPYVFALHLYAANENPIGQTALSPEAWESELQFGGQQLTADSDRTSWQQIRSSLPLEIDSRYLILQLSVRTPHHPAGIDYPGQFVDHVQITFKKF